MTPKPKVYPWVITIPKIHGTPYWLKPRDPATEREHIRLMRKVEREERRPADREDAND